jgi:hypothetical protein
VIPKSIDRLFTLPVFFFTFVVTCDAWATPRACESSVSSNSEGAPRLPEFDLNPNKHPSEPTRGSRESKADFKARHDRWVDGVLEWMKYMNDPEGVLDRVEAIGFAFEADGAVLGMTGHAGKFKPIRNVVLSTKDFQGKMYDFPANGDFATWNGSRVEIHYSDGRILAQDDIRGTIREKSRRIIKRMVKDAVRGDDLQLKWKWTEPEVLYFLFYAFREYVTANNPSFFLPHVTDIEVKQKPHSDPWSYRLKIQSNLVHAHSSEQKIYLDKKGRIGRIKYNFNLMDGAQGLMPIVHDVGGYVLSPEGISFPTKRRATIRWKKFSKRIENLAEDKADDMMDDVFGVFTPFIQPFTFPIVDWVVGEISDGVVKSVEDTFFQFSDLGMKGDVHSVHLYFHKSEIP